MSLTAFFPTPVPPATISGTPVTYYHGSDAAFTAFSLEKAGCGDRASNGALGVWLADEPCLAARFGTHLYAVTLPNAVPFDITITTLARWHDLSGQFADNGLAAYAMIRTHLLAAGYTLLRVVEKDASKPLAVALDPAMLHLSLAS